MRARSLVLGVACAWRITEVDGQTPAPSSGLTLADVIASTLSANPAIRTAVWTVRSSDGALVAAAAPFDPQVQMGLSADQSSTLNVTGTSYYLTRQSVYTAAVSKLLPWGLTISPSVTVANASAPQLAPGLATNTAAAGLNFTLPLMRDRWGAVTGSTLRAATRDNDGARLDFRNAVGTTIVTAAAAYWAYVAATRVDEAYILAESRAQQNVDQMQVLVRAEERTPADLNQVRGELATQRAARIGADQAVIAARAQLGVAMGVPTAAISSLPPPATDFPLVAALRDSAATATLAAAAVAHRPDIAALAQHRGASAILLGAAHNALAPRLDLQLGFGYNGIGPGWGFYRFVNALNQNVPGPNVTLQLSTDFSVVNSAARGQEAQLEAAEQQEAIAEADLRRHVPADVLVAQTGLQHGAEALAQAGEAVRLAHETVSAQLQRFKSGLATVFDVLLAEDGLTSAELTEIGDRQAYADAIVELRYASGTLLSDESGRPIVAADVLLTPP
jgi:outer membrane protein